ISIFVNRSQKPGDVESACDVRQSRAAEQHVVSVATVQGVVAGAADEDVVAVAAVFREQHSRQPRRCDDVVAAEAVDHDAIIRLEVGDGHRLGQARNRHDAVFVTVMTSSPLVALRTIVSAAPSPPPPVAPRSILTWLTSVPVRSLTVMVSSLPSARTSTVSIWLRSMATLPTSRTRRAWLPLAEMSIVSAALEPLNRSGSLPACPSTVSLPSPGFHTHVS